MYLTEKRKKQLEDYKKELKRIYLKDKLKETLNKLTGGSHLTFEVSIDETDVITVVFIYMPEQFPDGKFKYSIFLEDDWTLDDVLGDLRDQLSEELILLNMEEEQILEDEENITSVLNRFEDADIGE